PFASAPWQKLQVFWNCACPALIESGDDGTGFFKFLPAALPPGFCANAEAARSAESATAETDMSAVATRRIRGAPYRYGTRADFMPKPLARAATLPRPAPYSLRKKIFGQRLARHDDRDFLVADERAIVGAASQHVGARIAERDLNRLFAVGRNGRRRPRRSPRRVG